MPLHNFRLVTPEIAASAIPLSAHQIGEVRSEGIQTIISLLPKEEFELVGLSDARFRQAIKKNGLQWIRIPVSDQGVPTPKQFNDFCNALKIAETQNKRVLVHCLNGNGRVGTMISGYLIRQKGFFLEDAVRRVLRGNQHQNLHGMRFPESHEQEKFLAGLEAQRIAKRLPAHSRPTLYAFRKKMAESVAHATPRVPSNTVMQNWQRLLKRQRTKQNQPASISPIPKKPRIVRRTTKP